MALLLLRTCLVVGPALTALLTCAPTPAQAVRDLAGPALVRAEDGSVPVVAVAALLAWCLLVQVSLACLLTVLSDVPGRAAATGVELLERCLPVAVRRLAAGALGAGLLVGPGGVAAAASAPALDWPGGGSGAPVSLDWGPGSAPVPPPAPPPPPPPPAAPSTPSPTAASPGAAPASVVVRAGDSLWRLARADLPAGASDREVAQTWPSWWSANRDVVGDDPDVLHPGQALRPPP